MKEIKNYYWMAYYFGVGAGLTLMTILSYLFKINKLSFLIVGILCLVLGFIYSRKVKKDRMVK